MEQKRVWDIAVGEFCTVSGAAGICVKRRVIAKKFSDACAIAVKLLKEEAETEVLFVKYAGEVYE